MPGKSGSRNLAIAGASSLDELVPIGKRDELIPSTPGVFLERPISLLDSGDKVIHHDLIPARVKAAIIAEYGETYFLDTTWRYGTIRNLERILSRPRENLTNTLAMICAGSDRCPFTDSCFYKIAGKIPIGERCPVEIDRSLRLYDGYTTAISERLGVGPEDLRDDTIYSNMVWDIVECDLVKARCNARMGREGETGLTTVAIWQETGQNFEEEVESPMVRIIERYSIKKEKLLRSLIATPEMAARFMKKKANQDLHDKHNKLIEELESIVMQAKGVPKKTIDAEIVEPRSQESGDSPETRDDLFNSLLNLDETLDMK